MRGLLLALCVWTSVGEAKKIENVEFQDVVIVGSQRYVLNGVATRVKKKLGVNFKVYVAALYLPAMSTDSEQIIGSPFPKILELEFLREVDRETLQEAWTEAYEKNCGDDCLAAKGQLKAFNDLMVDVQQASRIKISFERGSVNVDVKGSKSNSAMIVGEAFRRVVLAMFIGKNPPTPELKKGLLGL